MIGTPVFLLKRKRNGGVFFFFFFKISVRKRFHSTKISENTMSLLCRIHHGYACVVYQTCKTKRTNKNELFARKKKTFFIGKYITRAGMRFRRGVPRRYEINEENNKPWRRNRFTNRLVDIVNAGYVYRNSRIRVRISETLDWFREKKKNETKLSCRCVKR